MAVTPPSLPPNGWPDPRSAYIHIPFCRNRCGYCNFSVLAGRDDLADAFLQALQWELSQLKTPYEVDTLYIGGGTPTHLPATWVDRLFDLVRRWFVLTKDAEFSVEANPGDLDARRIDVLSRHQVTRISLGVQSFDEEKLRTLQRDHDASVAHQAIASANQITGNVSIDLIFGVPNESFATWVQDLKTTIQSPIRHVSTYALTFEKGTSFWNRRRRGQLRGVPEEVEFQMYQKAREIFEQQDLQQYEISNFSKPGAMCRHNLAYWEGQGWLAFGPGAARFTHGHRQVNHRSPTTYIRRCLESRDPVAESEPISAYQWACERAAFGVRMLEGIDLQQLAQETGIDLSVVRQEAIEKGMKMGWIQSKGSRLQLSEQGILFADSVAASLLPDP